MNIYITKLNGISNTLQSIQCMTAEIAHQMGFREMGVYYYNANAEKPEYLSVRFDGIIAGMQAGDIVVCQFHTWNGLKFEWGLINHIKAYHGRVIIFIHSIEALMIKSSGFMLGQTIELYNQAEALIVPSYAMKKFLLDSGIRAGMKFIVQEMWDYTAETRFRKSPVFRKEIHCMGGLAPEVIDGWDYDITLKAYFSVAEKGQKVHGITGLNSDEQLMELSKGGFGLEWYADEHAFQYMRYGNSFSLSRYLAAGIPVIVPSGISCQRIIEENHLGLVADSLNEAVKMIENMDESKYQEYVAHIGGFAPSLRNGYYTKKCLTDAVWSLFREDVGKALVQANDVYELGEFEFKAAFFKESYGGNLALSWNFQGTPDGFLIYDSAGRLVGETENSYQHYFLLKEYGKEEGFMVKAYVNSRKGKMTVAKSETVYLKSELYKRPWVSVVIPAYNAEAGIVRSIDTVLAQSFQNLEVVAVDDGSSDGTAGILDWYRENYPNVVVVHQENKGVQAARNEGILHANGEYISFVDSDDMIYPDMIEKLYAMAKRHDCDVAMTSGYQIDRMGYTPMMQYSIKEDMPIRIEEFLKTYVAGGYAQPAVWNKLYRASLVKAHLFLLIRFEDEAWTPYVLSYAETVCYLNGCFYEYDRSTCGWSLVDQWAWKSKEDVFQDHKRSILFYLEHGDPKRRRLLQELAKSELTSFARATSYEKYTELKEQIRG